MKKQPFLTPAHLHELRQNADWRQLFRALGIPRDEKRSRDHDWWGTSPLNPTERTASFHMNDHGWYCHSTNRGGGVIELVQAVHPDLSCYDAGRWLLEHRVSSLVAETRTAVEAMATAPSPPLDPAPEPEVRAERNPTSDSATEKKEENRPIRQDLRPALNPEHPAFVARGVPPKIIRELGAGYWQRQKPREDDRPDPLNGRLVFQVRGLREDDDGTFQPTILTHTGRALTPEQEKRDGKWWTFPGFRSSLELYNLDQVILDEIAMVQMDDSEHILIVEGCFDVAKLFAADIRNVVATFGAHLHEGQIPRLDLLRDTLGVDRFLVWYDRDQDGTPQKTGAQDAVALLRRCGYHAETFDWSQRFPSPHRGDVPIPPEITDPAEFSITQLRWLRQEGVV